MIYRIGWELAQLLRLNAGSAHGTVWRHPAPRCEACCRQSTAVEVYARIGCGIDTTDLL